MSDKTILVRITHVAYARTMDVNGKPMDTQILQPPSLVKTGDIDDTLLFDLIIENEVGQISVKYNDDTASIVTGSSFKDVIVLGIVPNVSITNIGRLVVNPLE